MRPRPFHSARLGAGDSRVSDAVWRAASRTWRICLTPGVSLSVARVQTEAGLVREAVGDEIVTKVGDRIQTVNSRLGVVSSLDPIVAELVFPEGAESHAC
jgi:hypothetical protein